jgi:hypothetical protein
MIIPFGDLSDKTTALETLFRIAELLSLQKFKNVHPYDVILERRLLADPADDLKLSKLLSDSHKGESKPQEEGLWLGNKSLRGSVYRRSESVKGGGHLAQSMEGIDRKINCRSFGWTVPLISVWPPLLMLSLEAQDNVMWEIELQDKMLGYDALSNLAAQLDTDRYCGAFFVKVRN